MNLELCDEMVRMAVLVRNVFAPQNHTVGREGPQNTRTDHSRKGGIMTGGEGGTTAGGEGCCLMELGPG